uniref:Ig-like domain-containing protein n=1 Tax=Prolemur simus TaxID=1328070 RepID=A0A8C9DG80_PROSS
MGSRLLHWAMLCLLGTGPAEAGVTQTPGHLIKARGQQVTLRCSPVSGHNRVYWYQQALGQGPQFLIEYFEGKEGEKGNFPDRFSGHQFRDYRSELNVSALELGDSALYLCASSFHSPAEPPTVCAQTSLPQRGATSALMYLWEPADRRGRGEERWC